MFCLRDKKVDENDDVLEDQECNQTSVEHPQGHNQQDHEALQARCSHLKPSQPETSQPRNPASDQSNFGFDDVVESNKSKGMRKCDAKQWKITRDDDIYSERNKLS